MLAPLIPILYIFLSAILPAPLRWRWKVPLTALLALCALKLPLARLLGIPWYLSPDGVPRPLLLLSSGAYILTIVLTLLLLLGDAITLLPLLALRWRRRLPVRRLRMRLQAGLLALATLLTVVGMANAFGDPDIRRLTLRLPVRTPVTLALLTDLHADSLFPDDHIARMVDLANRLQPDFVLLDGDLVDGSPEQRLERLKPLANLTPRLATLGVPGNHEYYSDYTAWKPLLEQLNVQMLDNAHRDFPDLGLTLIGVTDPTARRFNLPEPNPKQATDGLPDGQARVALAHQPRLAQRFLELPPERRPHLLLAGHTHGGMMPLLSTFIARFNDGFVAGFYELDAMCLYVSRGTGIWNGFPIRLLCPAEVTLITLTPTP